MNRSSDENLIARAMSILGRRSMAKLTLAQRQALSAKGNAARQKKTTRAQRVASAKRAVAERKR